MHAIRTAFEWLPDDDGSSGRPLRAERFAELIDGGHSVLIDVREADETAATGSIRGAIHIPRGVLEFCADSSSRSFDPRLADAKRVLLYCDDGDRSERASTMLTDIGFGNVGWLDGGLAAWHRAGLPVYGARTTAS